MKSNNIQYLDVCLVIVHFERFPRCRWSWEKVTIVSGGSSYKLAGISTNLRENLKLVPEHKQIVHFIPFMFKPTSIVSYILFILRSTKQ